MAIENKQAQEPASNANNAGEQAGFPLGKTNFVLIAACVLLIVIGFALMAGSANTGTTWNPDIFSTRRIVVGPFVALMGFVLMIGAIMWRGKK